MIPEEKISPFAYVLAAVLALCLGGGWYWLHRVTNESPPVATIKNFPALPPLAANATLEQAEQYFLTWGGYAVWDHDVAEFALWSPQTNDYTQYFEARRHNGQFSFRRLEVLTRPLLDHGEPAHAPVAFTETAQMRAAYYRQHPGAKPNHPAWLANASTVPHLPPKSPERFSEPSRGAVDEANADDQALIADLESALASTAHPLRTSVKADLLAILLVNRVPKSISAGDRHNAIEGILAASIPFLNAPQLAVYRTELERAFALPDPKPAGAPAP